MAPRVNIRSSIYELCKKRMEAKKEIKKSSQTNYDNFDIGLSAQQNMVSPNECSNRFEICQQNIESYEGKDNFKIDLQSISMLNKSVFCVVNTNSVVVKVEDQGNEKPLWSKHQMSQKKLCVCPICHSSFDNETVLFQHCIKFHMKKRGRKAIPMECNVCQRKFACKVDFNIHYRTHTRKTKVRLNEPDKCSNRFEKYQQYIESYKEKDNVEVELQSASTSDFCRENMSTALKTVKDQGTNKNLKLNSQMSQKISFVCPICYSSFENISILIQHFKTFHGTKPGRKAIPMECNVCQMKFTRKVDYNIHYRTHSNKTYVCPNCNKRCFKKFSHTCKITVGKSFKKNVWDACKEVLTDKPIQHISCTNSEFVLKFPISNKFVYVSTTKEKSKNSKPHSITKYRTMHKKNQIINQSSLNSVGCAQNSLEKSFDKCKNFGDQGSDRQMYFEGEERNSVKTEDMKLFCNLCSISFEEIEKYEAHYSVHLNKELCQIREGDEELHVCNVCGWCFTEMEPFQVHQLTHVKKE